MKLLNDVKRENKWNLRTNNEQTAVITVFLERKKDFTCTFRMLQQSRLAPVPFWLKAFLVPTRSLRLRT